MATRGGASRASRRADKIPQLSCELCRERKIRCDKRSPCTNCEEADRACVPVHRKRLPRGRHVHDPPLDNDLKDRISRLEALITRLDSTAAQTASASYPQPTGPAPSSDSLPQATTQASSRSIGSLSFRPDKTEKGGTGRYLAKQFWGDLVEEIHGLRRVIEQPSDVDGDDGDDGDEDHGRTRHNRQQLPPTGSGNVIGTGSSRAGGNRSFVAGSLALRPSAAVCSQLCQVYLRQVDPIIKILHRPSLQRFMLDNEPYLGYEEGHFSVEALSSAVCYSAISSMAEEQCRSMFHDSKSTVVAGYRMACDAAIERAGLTTTNDITVLQAFVLYLTATRSLDQSRAVWTLIPVAVRIARALSLHLDDHRLSESIFDQQMRRRLWYTICLLDLQASFDRASEPLIAPGSAQPSMPRNVNDSDFGPSFNGDLPDRDDFTDMTFALVTYNGQENGKVLNFIPPSQMAKGPSGDMYNWEARQCYVERFEQQTIKLLQHCDVDASQYAWFTLHVSESMVAAMKLSALRPMYGGGRGAPPRVQSNSHLLQLAASVLEKMSLLRTDSRGEGYRWFEVVQWHTLAVAVAECYVCSDAALMRRLWPLVEVSFEQYSNVIADYRHGMLWRPMQKLMRETRTKISALLSPSYRHLPPSSGSGISPPGQALVPLNTAAGSSVGSKRAEPTPPASETSQPTPMSFDFTGATGNEASATARMPSQAWYPANPFTGQGTLPPTGSLPQMISDPAWGTWENFVNDLSFDGIPGAGFPGPMAAYGNTAGSTMHFH